MRKCPHTIQALASLAVDQANHEKVVGNAAYDAVTAALMSRPRLPERPPEPIDQHKHPGITRSGRFKKPTWLEPQHEAVPQIEWLPRELVEVTDDDYF